MKLTFDRTTHDEFVRIMDRDITMIAISSKSSMYPGLWMNKNSEIRITGVDLIW